MDQFLVLWEYWKEILKDVKADARTWFCTNLTVVYKKCQKLLCTKLTEFYIIISYSYFSFSCSLLTSTCAKIPDIFGSWREMSCHCCPSIFNISQVAYKQIIAVVMVCRQLSTTELCRKPNSSQWLIKKLFWYKTYTGKWVPGNVYSVTYKEHT